MPAASPRQYLLWRELGNPTSRPLPRPVTDQQLVLLNYVIGSAVNNRMTGTYLQKFREYDSGKNETTEDTITGTCKRMTGKQQF